MKNSLLLLILLAVCCYATDEWKFDYETAGNFTASQRWATGALNIIPGLGSMVIMDDFWGAVPQWSLSVAGGVLYVFLFTGESYYEDYNEGHDVIFFTGSALLASSFIYNIYRSITYDKPQKTAFGENSGFNLAVLPNRNGKLNAFLMYNKAF